MPMNVGLGFNVVSTASRAGAGGVAPSLSATSFQEKTLRGVLLATVTPSNAVLTNSGGGKVSLSGGRLRCEDPSMTAGTLNIGINGHPITLTINPYALPSSVFARWNALDTSLLKQNSDGTGAVSADGDPIGWIADAKSGRIATQATTASRPLYKTNVQNGKAGILFDGLNDFFNIVDTATVGWLNAGHNAKKYTLVAVVNIPDASASRSVISWSVGSGLVLEWTAASLVATFPRTAPNWNGGLTIGNGTSLSSSSGQIRNRSAPPRYNQTTIISQVMEGGPQLVFNYGFENGVPYEYSGNGSAISFTSAGYGPFTANTAMIGRRASVSQNYFKGYLLDLFLIDDAIGRFDMQDLHAYIGNIWGVTTDTAREYIDFSGYSLSFEDDFTADTVNPNPATDFTDPQGWLPGYPSSSLRTAQGTLGALAGETEFFADNRDPLVAATPTRITAGSVLTLQAREMPAALGPKRVKITGNCTCTTAAATITGSGTAFLTEISVGDLIYSSSNVFVGQVLSVASDTSLTLQANAKVAVTARWVFRSRLSDATLYTGPGTLSVTSGSKTVTGIGTSFLSTIYAGFYICDNSGARAGTVASVNSDTSITLVDNSLVTILAAAWKYTNLACDNAFISGGQILYNQPANTTYSIQEWCAKFAGPMPGDAAALWEQRMSGLWCEPDTFEKFPGGGDMQFGPAFHGPVMFYDNQPPGNGGLANNPTSGGLAGGFITLNRHDKDFVTFQHILTPTQSWFGYGGIVVVKHIGIDGVKAVSISNGGSGGTNGTKTIYADGNRQISRGAGNDNLARASLTTAGGIATSITFTKPGSSYHYPTWYCDYSANLSAGDTVTVNGVVLTAVASGAGFYQFNIGANLQATLGNISSALLHYDPAWYNIEPRVATGRLIVTCLDPGASGESITASSSVGTASGPTLLRQAVWYENSTLTTPLSGGVILSTDITPDVGLPPQYHQPSYPLMGQQIGAVWGDLDPTYGYPAIQLDYYRTWKQVFPNPPELVRGYSGTFDSAVDAAVATAKAGLQAGGDTVTSGRESLLATWIRALMAWKLRQDTSAIYTGYLDWDNTKLSLWDAYGPAIYAPFWAKDFTQYAGLRNLKNPGTYDLVVNGSGIVWNASDGSITMPGTSGVYLGTGLAIGSTLWGYADNAFEFWLTGTPTNASNACLVGFDANSRLDVSSSGWDSRMCASQAGVFKIAPKYLSAGHHVMARGYRPNLHMFSNGQPNRGGYYSGNNIAAKGGTFKIGSYDAVTVGAQFTFRLANCARRLVEPEAYQLNLIHREAMTGLGLPV